MSSRSYVPLRYAPARDEPILPTHVLQILPVSRLFPPTGNATSANQIRSDIKRICDERGILVNFIQPQMGATGISQFSFLFRVASVIGKVALNALRRLRRQQELRHALSAGWGFQYFATLRLRDEYSPTGLELHAAHMMELATGIERSLSSRFGSNFATSSSYEIQNGADLSNRLSFSIEQEALIGCSHKQLQKIAARLPRGVHVRIFRTAVANRVRVSTKFRKHDSRLDLLQLEAITLPSRAEIP